VVARLVEANQRLLSRGAAFSLASVADATGWKYTRPLVATASLLYFGRQFCAKFLTMRGVFDERLQQAVDPIAASLIHRTLATRFGQCVVGFGVKRRHVERIPLFVVREFEPTDRAAVADVRARPLFRGAKRDLRRTRGTAPRRRRRR
jgi:hypothetical protein